MPRFCTEDKRNKLSNLWLSVLRRNAFTLTNIRRVSSAISLNFSYMYFPQTSDKIVWYLTCVRVSWTSVSHTFVIEWKVHVSRLENEWDKDILDRNEPNPISMKNYRAFWVRCLWPICLCKLSRFFAYSNSTSARRRK